MLSRISAHIHRWRHAAEEHSVAIYAARWKLRFFGRFALIVFVLFFPPFYRYPKLLPYLIPALAAILVLMLIGERRKDLFNARRGFDGEVD